MARTCDLCHRKMSPFVPRKKSANDEMLCEGCRNGREGRPLSRHAEEKPLVIRAQAYMTPDAGGHLIVLAHGNMDGVTVFHCPFCGSGQVVNNGTSVECGFCHQNFTVLVQPQFPMMPQTIDGQPYTPGEQPGNDPTTPAPPGAPGAEEDDDGSFGGDQLSEKLPSDDNPDDDTADAAGGDDSGNPFAKKDAALHIAMPVHQQAAYKKIHMAPKPTADDDARFKKSEDDNGRHGGELRGNSHDRHARSQKLLKEFGDGKTAPCSYCGKSVDHKSVQQDKIYPHNGYRYNNLIPACGHCNESRGNQDVHKFMRSKRASKASFITEEGVVLPEEEYMAHIALKFSPHKDQTLAEVQLLHGRS